MIVERPPGRTSSGWSAFAIDPGETTGWAWACVGRREVASHGVIGALTAARRVRSGLQLADTRFMAGQLNVTHIDGLLSHHASEPSAVVALISMMQVCAEMGARCSSGAVPEITDVIIEDFVLRERTQARNLLSPVRLTAGIMQELHNDKEKYVVHMQSPSDAKSTVTDDRLRRWGFWIKGEEHARDATRHLILHLRKASGQA